MYSDYDSIIIKKQLDYVDKVTNIINDNKKQFITVIFTEDENKWQNSGIDYFYKCSPPSSIEERINYIYVRQRKLRFKKQLYENEGVGVGVIVIFDDVRPMQQTLHKLHNEHKCYKMKLLWIINDDIDI